MFNNIDAYAGLARQDIIDAINNYIMMYGNLRIVVYKDCNVFNAQVIDIREERDIVTIEDNYNY